MSDFVAGILLGVALALAAGALALWLSRVNAGPGGTGGTRDDQQPGEGRRGQR
jgi:hypothetical protein